MAPLAANGAEWDAQGRARGQNGQMGHGGEGWAYWWARMERETEGGGVGRFCGRRPLPMIVCNWGRDGRRGRPAWTDGGLAPLWAGYSGHGGLRPGRQQAG